MNLPFPLLEIEKDDLQLIVVQRGNGYEYFLWAPKSLTIPKQFCFYCPKENKIKNCVYRYYQATNGKDNQYILEVR